jgi:hypothetical protein
VVLSSVRSSVRIRIRNIFPDPYPTLMGPAKSPVRENLTTYACRLGHGGSTDKENLVKMNEEHHFRYISASKQ